MDLKLSEYSVKFSEIIYYFVFIIIYCTFNMLREILMSFGLLKNVKYFAKIMYWLL